MMIVVYPEANLGEPTIQLHTNPNSVNFLIGSWGLFQGRD
jgi:hypothetical protein